MKKKSVTIKDIAKEAGVSIATVSMIFNNKDKNISQGTRDRVMNIAKLHNYIPNSMARSLVTKRTKTLGLILPDIVNPFFPEIARGAEDKARESGYSIIICNTDDNLEQEDRYIEILTEKMVDGIIFTHSADRNNTNSGLERCRVPIILIDRDYDSDNVKGKVLIDNGEASYKGVIHLIEKGYRKITYIAGSLNTQTAKDRLKGYRKALEDNGIEFEEKYIKVGEYRSLWGMEAVTLLFEEGVDFDAIFCGNDLIAIGAMKKLKEFGKRIPEDIGIMGFDDIYMASLVEPELTTIKQPNYEMGHKAAQMLIRAIEGNEKNTESKIILETELVVRKSS
ncbi:LacI family DNA-binding transcriptional regulator [Alkalibacter mobilis]|uniref:LacI family DNA-binding transcriptional regulator n=1 Tax=Alkalibacter mobilis TaxID=2787712 RepID=UPI00189E199C|nr:LacI family DNA-binding transcriptional regulator [Alkalibacter mobilis]MBF7095578.1 LacI family DNA-binding transcriptional regulator [Alkalibacter mobilis]